MMAAGDSKGSREIARPAAKGVGIAGAARAGHDRQSRHRLGRPQKHKALPLSFHHHIQHPMHPVVEIDISGAGGMRGEESAGGGPGGCVARGIAFGAIRFRFDHHGAARAPDEHAAEQGPRAGDGVLRKKCAIQPPAQSPLG